MVVVGAGVDMLVGWWKIVEVVVGGCVGWIVCGIVVVWCGVLVVFVVVVVLMLMLGRGARGASWMGGVRA